MGKLIDRVHEAINLKNMQKVRQISALKEEIELIKIDMEVIKTDMIVMQDTVNSFEDAINDTSAKLDEIIRLFSIVFDSSGNITSNNYTTHKHNYQDATIADTADGTGTLSETTKQTTTKI